jgi:hypothetical protein
VEIASPVSKTATFVATVAEHTPIVPVPPTHERAMPPQPLGELPDMGPVRVWNSLMQSVWRAASSLLASMFAK